MTPQGQTSPSPPQGAPKTTTRRDIKNIPDIFDPMIQPLIDLVPDSIKKFVRTVPINVARSFPYYIFATMGLIAIIMTVQALREAHMAHFFLGVMKRRRDIAEQKDNFVALASHYLLTPLTLMHNGIDMVISLNELPAQVLIGLRSAVERLHQDIKRILEEIDNNVALQKIDSPVMVSERPRVLRSIYFWLPLVSSIALTLLGNFLLGVVADVDLGVTNLWVQTFVFVLVMYLLYLALRNRYLNRQEKLRNQELLEYENTIDEARNRFIKRSTTALSGGLGSIKRSKSVIADSPSSHFFEEGFERFEEILVKFTLLSKLQAGETLPNEKINLHEVIETILTAYRDQIEQKKLVVTNNTEPSIVFEQNKPLFMFVARSVIDNAIKFCREGDAIDIKSGSRDNKFKLIISDSGIGVPKEKLPQLFKPFSRATSSMQFDYEGLGFSLFLDKIIMDYIDGTISAKSIADEGTTITVNSLVSAPITPNAL
ncbi:MAG: HAMP domain-containing sensor histidine kinase [Candidatus Saccharimonadales bacterium]